MIISLHNPFLPYLADLLHYFLNVSLVTSEQIMSILSALHVGDRVEIWRELMYDGISWTSIVLIFIVASFLHNLFKYRHSNINNASPTRRKSTAFVAAFRLSPTTLTTRWHSRSPSQGRFILGEEGPQDNEMEVIRSHVADQEPTKTFEIKAGQSSPLEICYREKPPSLRTSEGGEEAPNWLKLDSLDEKKGCQGM